MDLVPSGRLTLKDLPREYQLLIPPPEQFKDPTLTPPVSVISVATETDGYFPNYHPVQVHPQSLDSVRFSNPSRTVQFSTEPNQSRATPEVLGCRALAGPDDEPGIASNSSKTSIVSISSSSGLDDEHDDAEESSPPLLPKYFSQGHRSELSTADSNSSLLDSCRKESRYNLRIQYDKDSEEELQVQRLESVDNKQQVGDPTNFLQNSKTISSTTGNEASLLNRLQPCPRSRDISTQGSSTTSFVPTMDLEYSNDETETDEPQKEIPFRNSRSYTIRRARDEQSQTEEDYLGEEETSEDDDDGRTLLNVSNAEESEEDSALLSALDQPETVNCQNNVVIVGAALSQVHVRAQPRNAPKSNQISIQKERPVHRQVSAQAIVKETRDYEVQTRIRFSAMNRLMSPPLNMSTYTQTEFPRLESPDRLVPVTAGIESILLLDQKKMDDQLPLISELTEAFGERSILETFGRKCMSMHNISDWNSSKFYFLTNSDENSYRRQFSHAEAMLYTVMCQDTFQQRSTMPWPEETYQSTISEPPPPDTPEESTFTIYERNSGEEETSREQPKDSECPYFVESPEGSISGSNFALSINSTLPTTSLPQGQAPLAEDETQTESVFTHAFPHSGTVSREPSDESVVSSGDSTSSYNGDADDELSSGDDDDDDSVDADDETEPDGEDGQRNPPGISTVAIVTRYMAGTGLTPPPPTVTATSADPSTSTLAAPTALVAQVLPYLSGAVIKRIIKRGKLKPTMSDFR